MKQRNVSKELLMYIVVGVFTTLINFIVYYIFVYLHLDYKIANTIAFIASVLFAFIANKRYVFLSDKGYLSELIKFSAGRVFTYILDIGSLILLVKYLEFDEYLAKVYVNGLVIGVNYFISKFWTFK